MEHFEKTLDSTPLYDGKILKLRRDQVELENGEIAYREVIEHTGGVAVFALDDADNVMMVSQFRYPFGKMLLELPAGKLELGENPIECGQRELLEECGCKAGVFSYMTQLYPTCAYDTEVIHIFFATNLQFGPQKLDENEFLTLQKIPVAKAVEMALGGELPDGKTQLAILTYYALHQAGRL